MKMTKAQNERLVSAFEQMAEDTHANMLLNQEANLNSQMLMKAVTRSAVASEVGAACNTLAHGYDGRIPNEVVNEMLRQLASVNVIKVEEKSDDTD